MLDSVLGASGSVSLAEVALCTVVSILLGVVIALVYMYRNNSSRGFVITLALLPVMVQSVILVVNGNLGAGVAVMGAFSLVRFRSVPGSAREIASIFFSMAAGLAAGMGYLTYAAFFTAVVSVAMLLYVGVSYKSGGAEKSLRVTIPEDADYTTLFTDVFDQYAKQVRLERVKTANLGSLFELQYSVTLRNEREEKAMLDAIRTRNGNLNIVCTRRDAMREEVL